MDPLHLACRNGHRQCVDSLLRARADPLKAHHLRLVLLRRLRLRLPLDLRRCKCGGKLDAWGDHRSACPTVGKLASDMPDMFKNV